MGFEPRPGFIELIVEPGLGGPVPNHGGLEAGGDRVEHDDQVGLVEIGLSELAQWLPGRLDALGGQPLGKLG